MGLKTSVLDILSGSTAADGTLTLRTRRREGGSLLCVQLVAVSNAETDACLADVCVERSALQAVLETLTLTTHAHTYNYYHPVWIPSEWQVTVRITSGGADKLVTVAVLGYLVQLPEQQPG